jgi:hypothetical protein
MHHYHVVFSFVSDKDTYICVSGAIAIVFNEIGTTRPLAHIYVVTIYIHIKPPRS